MTRVLCLAPSPSVDVTYVLDHLQIAGVNRPSLVMRVPGGKGLNAARSAVTWGAQVRVVAPLGGFSGEWIAGAIRKEGIVLDRILVSEETRTCVSLADTGSSAMTMTEVYENCELLSAAEVDGFMSTAFKDAGDFSWACISGSLPLRDDLVPAFVSRLCELPVRLAVDLAGVALKAALQNRPALIKVNRREASDALGSDISALAAARQIHDQCGALSVVTDGINGIFCVSDDRALQVRCGERGFFPVGSGDTFLGVLVAQLAERNGLHDSLVSAVAASVANALVPGAAVWDRAEAIRIERTVSVEAV